MSTPKNNLEDVLRKKAAASSSVNAHLSPRISAPQPKSKFKPATPSVASCTSKSLKPQRSFTTYSTPGFGKTKPAPLVTTPVRAVPNVSHAVASSSQSSDSPETKQVLPVKRASLNPPNTNSPPKRLKVDISIGKENHDVFQPKPSLKGKERAPPTTIPSSVVGRQTPPTPPQPSSQSSLQVLSPPNASKTSSSLPGCPSDHSDLDLKSLEDLLGECATTLEFRSQLLELKNNWATSQNSYVLSAIRHLDDLIGGRISAANAAVNQRKNKSSISPPSTTTLATSQRQTAPPLVSPAVSREIRSSSLIYSNTDGQIAFQATCNQSATMSTTVSSNANNLSPRNDVIEVDTDEDEYWNAVGTIPNLDALDTYGSRTRTSQIIASSSALTQASSASRKTPSYLDVMGVDKAREIRKDLLLILRNKFRLQEFRPNQREAIEAALTGHDVFVLMPTGGGKSLCFQAAALCQLGKTRGVTVVVCPLVALMADQLRALHEKNIDVVAFSGSSSGAEDYEDPTARLYSKEKPSLLYCTPEKLDKNQHSRRVLQHLHKTGNLARFVIDEAHCISVWGRNFRDAYKKLGSLRQEYPGVPIMTLTATASPLCENDIIKIMGIEGCVRIAQSFNRPNLIYEVRLKKKDVVTDIIKYIQQKHPTHTGVIYCNSRRQCEEVAAKLRKDGISAKHYHAELDPEDKKRVQTEWQCGKCKVIVATIAFGMGIDKADVRFVIHHTMPRRLDGYYQETGRAGRDGEPADCLCYSAYGDFISLQRQIREDETLSAEAREHAFGELERVFSYCQNDVDCRRSQVLSYFGEDFKKEDCKGGCDNCLGVFDTIEEDLTEAARIAIRLLERVSSGQVSKTAYTDLLSQNLKAQNHKLNKDIVNRLYEKLVEMRIFETESYSNNAGWNTNKIVVGAKADAFLKNKSTLKIKFRVKQSTKKKKTGTQTAPGTPAVNPALDNTFEDIDDFDDEPVDEQQHFYVDDEDEVVEMRDVPAVVSKSASANQAISPDDPLTIHQMCYQDLETLRDQIIRETGIGELADILDGETLQSLSFQLPGDVKEFKRIVREVSQQSLRTIEDKTWARFVNVCVKHHMANEQLTQSQTTSSSRFKPASSVGELRGKYSYRVSGH